MEAQGKQIRVKFISRSSKYVVTDKPIAVPTNVRRSHLSEMINQLLELESRKPFDFLCKGEFLRTDLDKFISDNGISPEEVLDIEYVEVIPPPEPSHTCEHEDWVSSVDGLDVGASPLFLTGLFDSSIHLWNASGASVGVFAGHEDAVRDVAWVPAHTAESADTHAFVSVSQDETARLWHISKKTHQPTKVMVYKGHTAAINAVAVQPTGKMFCTAGWDRTIKIWQTSPDAEDIEETPSSKKSKTVEQTVTAALNTLMDSTATINTLVWPDRGTIYSAGEDHCVRQWDAETGENVRSLTGSTVINHLDHSKLNGLIASAEFDGNVRIYDIRSATAVVKLAIAAHQCPVSSTSWSKSESHQIVSCSLDRKGHNVKIWDIRSKRIPLYMIGEHDDKVFDVKWMENNMIISGGSDKKLIISRINASA